MKKKKRKRPVLLIRLDGKLLDFEMNCEYENPVPLEIPLGALRPLPLMDRIYKITATIKPWPKRNVVTKIIKTNGRVN